MKREAGRILVPTSAWYVQDEQNQERHLLHLLGDGKWLNLGTETHYHQLVSPRFTVVCHQ